MHSWELNLQTVDYKSDALTSTLPNACFPQLFLLKITWLIIVIYLFVFVVLKIESWIQACKACTYKSCKMDGMWTVWLALLGSDRAEGGSWLGWNYNVTRCSNPGVNVTRCCKKCQWRWGNLASFCCVHLLSSVQFWSLSVCLSILCMFMYIIFLLEWRIKSLEAHGSGRGVKPLTGSWSWRLSHESKPVVYLASNE